MFKDVDLVCVFLRNPVFAFDKNIHWPTFVSSFSAVYRVSIPGVYSHRSILLFQAARHGRFLHIAFARDVDINCGTLISREPQTRRLCKHSLKFSHCNKYH